MRVTACGLCGSDLKAQGSLPAGTIMGHEFGGQVVEVGAGVRGWRQGVQVAVLPVASCGTCAWCRSGEVAHCTSAGLIGLGGGAGGFAELTVVPAASSFEVPTPVDPLHAALVEPFAVGLHCVQAGQIAQGDDRPRHRCGDRRAHDDRLGETEREPDGSRPSIPWRERRRRGRGIRRDRRPRQPGEVISGRVRRRRRMRRQGRAPRRGRRRQPARRDGSSSPACAPSRTPSGRCSPC